MADRLREIPGKILEWWKKFSTKQKALLISSVAVVVVAFAILGIVISTPTMTVLKQCENTSETAQVRTLLTDNNIECQISSDGLVVSVPDDRITDAQLLLAENNITADALDWENLGNVFDGGLSLTEADKTKRYQLAQEIALENKIETLSVVNSAEVQLSIPPNDGTLISRNEESYAWIILDLNGEMQESAAQGLAKAVATALGNDTTDNITILDQDVNVLFAGGQANTSAGTANDNLAIKNKAESLVSEQVTDVMMETRLFDSVSVAPNLDIQYTEQSVTDHLMYPAEGLEQGLISSEREYESDTTGGSAAEPGTGSNDAITYVMEDGSIASATITESEREYDNSERITVETTTIGRPNYETSSLALVASRYRIYDEDVLRESGQLDGMTFDEFKEANEERVRVDIDEELVTLVANATGIPFANISLVAYEVPLFNDSDETATDFSDYLPIILAVLIMLMLGFVVFRSTRREPELETQPELSVEALLESTREAQVELEDIGFAEKSEARLMIERFVDENPEAAAALLRNWLNEEWE